MAIRRDITAADQVFFDTRQLLRFGIYLGNTSERAISLGDAIPVDVGLWPLEFVVRRRARDEEVILRKTTALADGIEVSGTFNVDPETNNQVVEVTLDAADLRFAPGHYDYALRRSDEANRTVLTYGTFELLISAAWSA